MPIDTDQFESEPEDILDINQGTQPHAILTILASNDDQAFTQTEIEAVTDIPRGSVGVVLSRLENRGLVRHRGRYWAISEGERLASYAAQQAASSASTSDKYYGEPGE
jgi:predicted transcriptional regulator of viral defense system